MYDLSKKMNTFYNTKVVLPKVKQDELINIKNINITRLKDGLKEYNEEFRTKYKMIESPVVQGSMAMNTVTQNDKNDYDIDIAIIFDKDNIPDGNIATKNIIVNALKRKTAQFNVEPEFKTNCVTIHYNDGYHLDFAIYRRTKNIFNEFEYEHCGSNWTKRNPRDITNWLNNENKNKEYKLKKVIRLLKMFCKSRDNWKMPGGLIQSVLVNECDVDYSETRLDKIFYDVITSIRNRLIYNLEIYNPVEANISLLQKESDRDKVENLKNRLNTYIDKLDIIFKNECTEKKAISAWNDFFNHSYWSDLADKVDNKSLTESYNTLEKDISYEYNDTEEDIQDLFPVNITQIYDLKINCKISQDGFRIDFLKDFLIKKIPLRINKKLIFYIENTNIPEPYEIYWKVTNVGEIAKEKNCIRGQIFQGKKEKEEHSNFRGEHFVECYIIKSGVCVAFDRIDVPISEY